MPGIIWQKVTGPSAGMVQEHYLKARLEELKRRNPELEEILARKLRGSPMLARVKLDGDRWLEVYHKINKRLQAADLTINFKEQDWFATENTHDSYTQMYERAQAEHGKKVLMSNSLNPAYYRAEIDDAVTIPAAWNRPAAPAQRGLSPGGPSGQRLKAQMAFGEQKNVAGGIESANPHFNPKTKQIFAALNYGRRPHGSCTLYGESFLTLSPKLKVNALYLGGDTFTIRQKDTRSQMPYPMLAAVMAAAHSAMVRDIISSCYFKSKLPDCPSESQMPLLLEGHIFGALPFAGNLETVTIPNARRGSEIARNAAKFAKKHGARLKFVG